MASTIHPAPDKLPLRIFGLCGLSLLMDGFDVQAMGYVAPAIMAEWHMSGTQLGSILAATNFGLLLGALIIASLADRFGRRPVLILCTCVFAILALLTARAQTIQELMSVRFLAGIGMGAIMPNATTLVAEYSPPRLRSTLLMLIAVTFTAGGALGSFAAAAVIPLYGWRAVFYAGGVIPLVCAVWMYLALPESPGFRARRGRAAPDAGRPASRGLPVGQLLSRERAGFTLLYWVVNFANLLNLYFLAGLLPTIFHRAGMSPSTSAWVGGTVQVGGVAGVFLLAWLVQRWDLPRTLIVSFLAASGAILLLGADWSMAHRPVLVLVVFVAGIGIIAAQPALNALGANFYPTSMRSTGLGWGIGIGRIGAILGPFFGGRLLDLSWSRLQILSVFSASAALAALGMVLIRRMRLPGGPAPE